MTEINRDGINFNVDRQNLYREESFTDLKVASIRRLTPVKTDGTTDKTRRSVFVGHTSLLTPNGPVPLQAVINAKDLQQALKRFPEAMDAALDKLVDEAKKFKEEESSRIIVPGQ